MKTQAMDEIVVALESLDASARSLIEAERVVTYVAEQLDELAKSPEIPDLAGMELESLSQRLWALL